MHSLRSDAGRYLTLLVIIVIIVPTYLYSQDTANKDQSQSPRNPSPSLSEILSQSVVFLYEDLTPKEPNQKKNTEVKVGKILATGFIVGVPDPNKPEMSFPFIVTAKHVIAGQHRILGRYSSKKGDNPLYAEYDLDQLRKDHDLWEYPNDEGVDIVVFRSLHYEDTKSEMIPIDYIATKDTYITESIEVGDRVMIPCLLARYPGISQNYPIFRDGTIALINQEPIEFSWKYEDNEIQTNQRLILINSTINEGFSGAPVFLWPGVRQRKGVISFGGKPWLLGLVHGFQSQYRKLIDDDGADVIIKKPANELPGDLGQLILPREVPVYSQENSATGFIFPSWLLNDILQSDAVKKRVQELSGENKKRKM